MSGSCDKHLSIFSFASFSYKPIHAVFVLYSTTLIEVLYSKLQRGFVFYGETIEGFCIFFFPRLNLFHDLLCLRKKLDQLWSVGKGISKSCSGSGSDAKFGELQTEGRIFAYVGF